MPATAAEVTIERPAAELIVEDVSFWFIWTKTGHLPRKTHTTWAEAETEAIRLAHLVPGKKFIVLEARSKLHVEPASLAKQEA